MPFTTKSISFEDELLAQLDSEAASELVDRSTQLRRILTERYKTQPRLEDKLKAGSLRKDV